MHAVLRSKLVREPRLRYVDFSIDFRCNLRCEHCFATALEEVDARPRMGTADYARVAAQAMALGAVNFSFQGGEPLLCRELPEYIAACRPDRNVISVSTNGTLVTAEKARWLREIGVDILTISLDSASAQEHDAFRGVAGSWKRAMDGIRAALAAGMHVTLATVVTHQNLRTEGITDLLAFAKKQKLLLYLLMPVPVGSWDMSTSVLLTEEDLATVDAWTHESPHIRTDFQANLGGYGCGAAKEILYLTQYGDVLPCPFLHIAFGNVMADDIETIRARALAVPCLSRYHDRCLASTDAEFLAPYLEKTHGRQGPVPYTELFPGSGPELPSAPPLATVLGPGAARRRGSREAPTRSSSAPAARSST